MLLAGGALALTACNDDMLDANKSQQQYEGNYFHVVAGVNLPTAGGTRSQTDGDDDTDVGETNSNGSTSNGSSEVTDDDGVIYNDDFEYGYSYENEIRSMILVFTNENYEYVCHSIVNGITNSQNDPVVKPYSLTVKAELKTDDLEKAYATDGVLGGSGDKIIYVFAFCNPPFDLLNKFENTTITKTDKWYDWFGTVEEAGADVGVKPTIQNTIWARRSFFMSNARIAKIKFPDNMEQWSNYADKEHPYILNSDGVDDDGLQPSDAEPDPIFVERAAARIDFKDGSPDPDNAPNTYPIMLDNNGNGEIDKEDLNIISIRLNRMCLVNMSKNYYYLRRVSADGTSNNWSLCGKETSVAGSYPYVVDTDWDLKKQVEGYNRTNAAIGNGISKGYGFNFPFYSIPENDEDASAQADGQEDTWKIDETYYNRFAWYVDRINDVINPKNDDDHNKDTWDPKDGNKGDYRIWRYVVENTIPEKDGETSQQKTIQSTGIVFKGAVVPGKHMFKDGSTTEFNEEAKKYMSEAAMKAIADINDHENIAKDDDDDYGDSAPKLFSFENRLYAGVDDILEYAAREGQGSPLHMALDMVLQNWVVQGPDDHDFEYTPGVDQSALEAAGGRRLDATTAQNIVTNDQDKYVDWTIEGFTLNDVVKGDENTPDKREGGIKVDDNGNKIKVDDTHFVKHAAKAEIATYRPYNEEDGDGWGYYCYYVYWNRHNDNLKSGQMGKNEFAIVRNNVYKLAVTSIDKLGHPRVKDYDPDPFDPEDPDEDATQFLRVNVEVLPWVVRVNNIEF